MSATGRFMTRKKKRRPRPLAIPHHPWAGTPMLEKARQLNARCFAALVQAVKTRVQGAVHSGSHATPVLEVLSEFVSQIDARVCERAGSCPVLLLDLHFNAPDYWDRVTVGMRLGEPAALFTQDAASPLVHEILMQAWTLVHNAPRAARIFFGMAPQVTQVIAQLPSEEIGRIAHEYAVYLRPRWEDRRTFWQRLLEAATTANHEALVDVQLHCLSLLGGELVAVPRVG